MNYIFNTGEQILLNKLLTFGQLNVNKTLFDNINLILQVDIDELKNNSEKNDIILDNILRLTNKNIIFNCHEIDKMLIFEKMLFNLVELNILDIEYYVQFISNMPESLLNMYICQPRIKNYTLNILEYDYYDESKKLIDLINKKYF